MISRDALSSAVERGLMSPEQVAGLRALEAARARAGAEPRDEEAFRFIAGFGDLFVTIGLGLFLGAVGYFAGEAAGSLASGAALAGAAWTLAEFFTRRRRMALPSIVLLLVFALGAFWALVVAFGGAVPAAFPLLGLRNAPPLPVALAALATAGLVGLHYRRFRVPITVAAGAAALAATAAALGAAAAPELVSRYARILVLALGLGVFALAMRYDLSDPQRATRRTDIAFWLHLLAAPMVVHPLVAGLVRAGGAMRPDAAAVVLAIFLGLGAVAVLIDRRAVLVSGLAYAGYAFATLIRGSGLADQTLPATLLVLGAFVLLLSAGWRPLRRAALRLAPAALARRLPPPSAASAA